MLSAEDLATLYLAYVISIAKRRMFASLGGDSSQIRVAINSAGPLDQVSDFGSVGQYFERALYHGSALSDRAMDGWLLDEALESLRRSRETPVPPVELSVTRVFPETHAAMTAYLLLPQSEPGLYGLVDVGAGTTDVAFFWLQKDENATKAWYYAAGSRRVGMDDVDSVLQSVISAENGNVRAAREALSDDELAAHLPLIEPVAKQIRGHQAHVLDDAMRVDQRPKAWFANGRVRYRLFLAGGGSMCRPLVEGAVAEPLRPNSTWDEEPAPLAIPPSTKVAQPDGSIVTVRSLCEPAAERLLLLACGLAHPRPDIPKFERDVEGVKSPAREPAYVFEVADQWW